MNKQEKRRLVFILSLLAFIVVFALIVKIDNKHIVGYDNYDDLVKNIAMRNDISEKNVIIDTVREEYPYVFVCYHTKGNSTLYLQLYRLSCENIFFRNYMVLTYCGGHTATDSISQHTFNDDDTKIFVVWGDNKRARISAISFDIGGKTISKDIADLDYYDSYFIEPFILAYEEENPQNVALLQ